jgi:hypothetical protein
MTAAKQLSFTGTEDELRERLATMEVQGVMGADVPQGVMIICGVRET